MRSTSRRRVPAIALALGLTAAAVSVSSAVTSPAGAAPVFSLAWTQSLPGMVGRSAPVYVPALGASQTPSVVIGDQTGTLYGRAVANGASISGWGALHTGAASIDAPLSTNGASVFVPQTVNGVNAPEIAAFSAASGARQWSAHGCPISHCDSYFGMSVAPSGSEAITGGGQYIYGVSTSSGASAWNYLNSDTTNTSAAWASLTGSGTQVITTNDQTGNSRVSPPAQSGGHLRIFTSNGIPLCDANIGGGPAAPGSFDSSPAIASFGDAPMIVFGSGQSGTLKNQVVGYNSNCQRAWTSSALAGPTVGAPAIADTSGTGIPTVIELVAYNNVPYVYELDGRTGAILRSRALPNPVAGGVCNSFAQGTASSVVTADLSGTGHQDLLVPAGACGVIALDGRDLSYLGQLGRGCAVQNTPVVTSDPGGHLGITMAGYRGTSNGAEGCVFHYTVAGGSVGSNGWQEFHHDNHLTGALTQSFGVHDTLLSGQRLSGGQRLVSSNGRCLAMMSTAGRLTVYSGSKAVWATGSVTGAYLVVGSTLAEILQGSTRYFATTAVSASRPLSLALSPVCQLTLSLHDGNEWAADHLVWRS